MAQEDIFQITIRVADIPEFTLTIRRDEEELYRMAIRDVNKLWSNWKGIVKDKDSNKIITVIALRYAKQFYKAMSQMKSEDEQHALLENETLQILGNFEKEIDNILLDINGDL
ncbi:MAG: cell division protein ZapA [Muribaculaceae bacterium]|nr:cell division protein ZapA [Muribaculaceae bacterium]